MVVITVEAYENARVHTITVKHKDFFWVKMKDIQDRLGMKNISDLLRYIRSEYQLTKTF